MLKKLLLLLVLLSVSVSAETQNKDGAWFGTFSKKQLNDNFSWWSEAQLRYSFDQGGVGQFLYRTGLLYKLNDTQGLGFLYGYISTGQSKEHRWTMQHTQSYYEKDSFKLSSRSRLEFRDLEDNPDSSIRLRYLIRGDFSSMIVWNEAFINLTEDSWTGERFFERNRLFLGLKSSVFNSRIEYGYLNQYVPRDDQDTSEHLLVLYFFM